VCSSDLDMIMDVNGDGKVTSADARIILQQAIAAAAA
jgi:hypothetical protein